MFGATGVAGAVALGLFLSAIALGFFLLFRKTLSTSLRAIIAGILLLLGIGGAAGISALTLVYDAAAEAKWREDASRSAEASRRMREEHLKRRQEKDSKDNSNAR